MNKTKIRIGVVVMSLLTGSYYCIAPVLGSISEAFPEVSTSNVQMLVTVPNLLSMVIGVIAGWLVVKFSKKQLLLAGMGITFCFGFLPFFLKSFALIMISRTLLGIGVGLVIPINTAIISEHFEGNEKSTMMGIQSACVGLGMTVMNLMAGWLGNFGYRYSFFIYVLSFLGAVVLSFLIPETGKAVPTKTEKISLNKKALMFSAYGLLQMIFLMAFTTNIAMHIGGAYAGNTSISGTVTSVFSVGQLLIGLSFGLLTRVTKRLTLPVSTLCGGVGLLLLLLFPGSLPMLFAGALFCGFCQGIFIPQAFVEVTNCVPEVASTLASGCLNIFTSIGQLVSPYVLNAVAMLLFGNESTNSVYTISSIGMLAFGLLTLIGFAAGAKKQ